MDSVLTGGWGHVWEEAEVQQPKLNCSAPHCAPRRHCSLQTVGGWVGEGVWF